MVTAAVEEGENFGKIKFKSNRPGTSIGCACLGISPGDMVVKTRLAAESCPVGVGWLYRFWPVPQILRFSLH